MLRLLAKVTSIKVPQQNDKDHQKGRCSNLVLLCRDCGGCCFERREAGGMEGIDFVRVRRDRLAGTASGCSSRSRLRLRACLI